MGHGWVTPNADGSKARCGGPGLCSQCKQELAVAAANRGLAKSLSQNKWIAGAKVLREAQDG